MKKTFLVQSVKYGIVGVINTLVTLVVIWLIMRYVFGIENEIKATTLESSTSNVIGYIAGLLNSFFLNRSWTFKSKKNWKPEFVKFILGFFICYIPQLILLNVLNTYIKIDSVSFELFGHDYVLNFSYICQIIGNVFYTILNFIFNKYYTFKK